MKQTWNVWSVSSLFGFEYDNERQLKVYARILREGISTILPKDDVTYDVNFDINESITNRPSATDPPAIKVNYIE